MAAIARPQSAGGSNSIKVALVVFVVLTVVSLTGAIIIFTNYSDMQQRIDDSQSQITRTGKQLRDAQEQLKTFARMVVDESTDDTAKIKQSITSSMQQLEGDPALAGAIDKETAVLTALETLYDTFKTQGEQLAQVTAERDRLTADAAQNEKANQQVRQEFTDKIAELESAYKKLEQQGEQNHEQWNAQVAKLAADLEKASESAGQQLAQERKQREQIAKQRDAAQKLVEELTAKQASFRPSADLTSALQIADGHIVRVVVGEDIAYISLGREDGVRRGMTFSVYSRLGGITPDGKGKATLEVVNPFETTSECRVTSTTPGQPIVENDVIANPVFDKSRKLNFLVAGDFDLNFDGKVDDEGGKKVTALIEQAGGNVVNTIDTQTDFAVLGGAPPLVMVAEGEDSPEVRERAAQLEVNRKAFDKIVNEAKALSIPVLTRTQFLHFIGVAVPQNAS